LLDSAGEPDAVGRAGGGSSEVERLLFGEELAPRA
jgi:hypothetical protein